jgi:2-dehydro-3-deoxyphosphooctonate aldolase (KDO 8-P synthase)
VAESRELCFQVAKHAKEVCDRLGIGYIFKASFDKANRASVNSLRGHGLDEGLEMLKAIKEGFGLPLLTDVHEVWQVEPAAEVVDILQIPAFLCRQTDLVVAAAQTGKSINVKKGQFLAPWDMKNVVEKVLSTGNESLMLTERGCSFGYNTLVVDMTSLPVMRSFGYPVIFDATHSVQRPGGAGTSSGGAREFVPDLVRAAVAVGIDALFLEIHPDPDNAWSDKASMLQMGDLEKVLTQAQAIEKTCRCFES